MKRIKSIHKLSIKERKEVLKDANLYNEQYDYVADDSVFSNLVENYITTYEIPLGIAPNFLIDGKYYHIPMATEESSVIAGASHAAKIIERNGGFKIDKIERVGLGQIIFMNVKDFNLLNDFIINNKENIYNLAKETHPNIYKLGGGLLSFHLEQKEKEFACLYLKIDTLDAMGANTINIIIERIASFIETSFKDIVLMSILSNLSVYSLVTASVEINPKTLKNSDVILNNITDASLYASIDSFRAATHNKGIMNGISALMLATGNDTRAIEAGAHAFASISGKYLPLATWHKKDDVLIGTITIPLQLGTFGGAINVLPKAKLSLDILKIKKATDLMKVAAALGLAQNFAALYALTTEGINKGHLRLHARSIAIKAGANLNQIDDVVNYLLDSNYITISNAIKFIKDNYNSN